MTAIIVLFSAFAILCLLRVPIAISLGLSSILALFMVDFTLYTVSLKMFNSLNSATLMAIPGFVFAGIIMSKGGISYHLIESLKSWVGHMRGGLAVVTILACMIFAAISGSSPATAAAIGGIMIPAMVKAGYSKRYSMGLVAAAGTLGILIPPSIPLIIYATVAEESVGKLFAAGIIPGLMLGGILLISAIFHAKRHNYGKLEKAPMNERWKKTYKAIWGFLLPVFILGGIYSGIVTPTEAAFVSCLYGLIVSVFIYKEMTFKKFREVLKESINVTAMIFLVIASAMVFGMFLTTEQVPQAFALWIEQSSANKWIFILGVNIMFFILGMFLEATAIILITLPILLPVLALFDINIIHFAIIMTINMELAMITPPVGLNLFVVSGITKEKVGEVIKGVMPFFGLMVVALILVILFPQISLFLAE
ncbi:C4-dicarboxylate transporter, DctM subunit [Cytobacillus horneckiae]|uniref:C4-dicarboxylate ABC transporter permease n=1 Tax=Cytobacillus horneckiae TaxID=549687 RepID=A0A2N0ZIT7_9BACI|nr:TRAP transporter large permease subunit [Cytobacillus horneckiae]MBN6886612.1 TRAP transporter large permease subunit [Cytobacillus horneckiae]MCM3177918.1 TRAP transporter large permease subunit [Cytobacillus horneckiae]MEC1157275.1 TRAP transporter large permease subunit [Cytobacillus horneckiae]MED2935844.1 TRAP transporter large permease subunit [Cytobacillus horneckiae]PKG29429.1 C4-dicarboxylate ABC transporter permease [Cytobacillus horneckiae]